MKITRTNPTPTNVILTITLSANELAGAEQVALVRLGEKVKVPGFRAGKAPVAMIKKQVSSDELDAQTMSDAINAAIPSAFDGEKVQPLQRPTVEVKKYVPGQELEFTAESEILPQIKLPNYKNLTVTKSKISVTAKDVDEVVERMRTSFAEKKEVKRAAKTGDEVTIDFEGIDAGGEAFAGGSGKDYPLTLGSNTFIPGFEEGVAGKKADENFDLPITFPKDYHAAHLAGTDVTFKVSIKTIKEVTLPKVDDAFAKKTGPFLSVAELKADIKKEITAQRQNQQREEMKDELVDQLVKAVKPAAPTSLVEDQMKHIETDFVQNLAARGMNLDQFLKDKKLTKQQWQDKDLRAAASRRIQSAMILSELSRIENIEVLPEEIQTRHEAMLRQYPDPNMRLQLETPEARSDLANRIMTEKTLERLIDLNTKK